MFLNIMAISAIFVAINAVIGSIFRVKKKIKQLIIVNVIGTIVILGLSYILISQGLIGIGYAWVIGTLIMSLVFGVMWVMGKR